MDRTYFKTGSDELTEGSEQQLKNIVAILKAYPKAAIRLGGYTDNTGSVEGNKKLSERRANSVLNKLVALGANKAQLSAQVMVQNTLFVLLTILLSAKLKTDVSTYV
ncbi:Inner membrane lipoprotein YiaD precursor [Capnocytophaga ochracea]|uniref:Inner membrane lipoprotein YiaD n=1 Tax=Capnocytophaga ochracea TaxID=1018 RepID=A0A2X2SRA2_CAPOC|nr:Inner membrane lipoprotein YiaD precursor [Capnocytophaga ochracea]